ncbi:hypothetical protein PLICRDRAFT_181077, partial [Plicaturopsis crispa FD-325 SS-3]
MHHAFIPVFAYRRHRINEGTAPAEWWEIFDHWNPAPEAGPFMGNISLGFARALRKRAAELEEDRLAMVMELPTHLSEFVAYAEAFPAPIVFEELETVRLWEDHLDACAYFQRCLCYKAAWINMMERLRDSNWSWDVSSFENDQVPRCQDLSMGIWINSAPENFGRWFLAQGVPVYFVNRYVPKFDYGNPERRQRRMYPDWLVPYLPIPGYPAPTYRDTWYDITGRRGIGALSKNELPVLGEGRSDAHFTQLAGNKSASWVQGYLRPAAELCQPGDKFYAWRTPSFSVLEQAQSSSSSAEASRPASPALTEVEDAPVNPAPTSTDDGAIMWADKVVIDPTRYPWIRPPPIATWTKGWTHFEETEVDGVNEDRPFLLYRGKNNKPDDLDPWYDREKGRVLYFDNSLFEVLGLVENPESEWGRPVPKMSFRSPTPDYRPVSPSKWMYKKRAPTHKGWIGRVHPTPAAAMLPPLAGTAPPAQIFDDEDDEDEDMGLSTKIHMFHNPAGVDDTVVQGLETAHAPAPLIEQDQDMENEAERVDYGTPPPQDVVMGPSAPEEGELAVRLSASPSPEPAEDGQADQSMQIDPAKAQSPPPAELPEEISPWLRFYDFLPHVTFADVERTLQHVPDVWIRPRKLARAKGPTLEVYGEYPSGEMAHLARLWWEGGLAMSAVVSVAETASPVVKPVPPRSTTAAVPWYLPLSPRPVHTPDPGIPVPPSPATTSSSMSSRSSLKHLRDEEPAAEPWPRNRMRQESPPVASGWGTWTTEDSANAWASSSPADDWHQPPASKGKGKQKATATAWEDIEIDDSPWSEMEKALEASRNEPARPTREDEGPSNSRPRPMHHKKAGKRQGSGQGQRPAAKSTGAASSTPGNSLLQRMSPATSRPLADRLSEGASPSLLQRMKEGSKPEEDAEKKVKRRLLNVNPPPPSG